MSGRPAGAIDGEEPQASGRDVVEFAVAMGEEFVALLGSGVEAYGVVHAVVHAEGHLLVAAIDAATAGIDQMLHRMVPAGLKDVVKTKDVALNVGIGVLDAVAYTRLGGEIDHDVEMVFVKKAIN